MITITAFPTYYQIIPPISIVMFKLGHGRRVSTSYYQIIPPISIVIIKLGHGHRVPTSHYRIIPPTSIVKATLLPQNSPWGRNFHRRQMIPSRLFQALPPRPCRLTCCRYYLFLPFRVYVIVFPIKELPLIIDRPARKRRLHCPSLKDTPAVVPAPGHLTAAPMGSDIAIVLQIRPENYRYLLFPSLYLMYVP